MTGPGETSLNLFQQQELNRRRTAWLMGGFIVFFAWLGFGGDLIYSLSTAHAPPPGQHHVWWFGFLMCAIGAILAAYAYQTGPEKVLWATGATEVVEAADDQQRQLMNVVEEMAIAAGVPRPRVWIVPDQDPNAFATGTDPRSSHIAVTQGLLDLCGRDELQAVVGHELGHIKNLDIRLMTTLAALVGAVVLMRDGTRRLFLPGQGSSGGRAKKDLGPFIIILIVLWLVSWALAPLITQLLALAVSRKREYLADAMGAQFTRNPLALASALQKIEAVAQPTDHITGGAAHMCIADPLGRRLTAHEGFLADVLATHPPMAKRIAILRGMGYAQLKKESGVAG